MFLWIASMCGINAPDYAPVRRFDARMREEIFWLAGFFGFLVAASLVIAFAVAALISSGLISAQLGEVLIFWLIGPGNSKTGIGTGGAELSSLFNVTVVVYSSLDIGKLIFVTSGGRVDGRRYLQSQ